MPARRILVAYGTKYGQTARIAARIADVLAASGDVVTLTDVGELPRKMGPREFAGVVIGASVIGGRHQRRVRRFVRAHRNELNAMPTAFFSVSGSAASPYEASRAVARRNLEEMLRETGWRPRLTELVAGSIAYTKYSPPIRWLLKRIVAKEGGPTDTSRDHESTDWTQVQRFAETFSALVPRAVEAQPIQAQPVQAQPA
jgi:menaquinone-dependent protoporphyrinogen oxidase